MLPGLCRMVVSRAGAAHKSSLRCCSRVPAFSVARYCSRGDTLPQLLSRGISNQRHLVQHNPPYARYQAASSLQDAVSRKQEPPTVAAQPTILTVSWLGANPKPFGKYTQLWQALGYPQVTSARPPLASIVVPALGQRMAAQLAHKWVTSHHNILAPGAAAATSATTAPAAADGRVGGVLEADAGKQTLRGKAGGDVIAATPVESTSGQAGREHQVGGAAGAEADSHLNPGPGTAATGGLQAGQLQQQQQQQQDPGVLIHLFSGGGYIFTAWLMQQLVAQGAPEQLGRIRGIIFDSSPAQVIPDVAARALVAAVLGEPAEKVQERHPLLVGGTSAAVGAYLKVPLIKHCIQEVHDTWAQLAPPCPMLFLHSAADVLVPPEVVQAFMKQQAARGAAVSDKLWPDSPHVDHWRAYPQEYEQQLQRFASRVLHPDAGDSDCDAGRDWSIPAGRERG